MYLKPIFSLHETLLFASRLFGCEAGWLDSCPNPGMNSGKIIIKIFLTKKARKLTFRFIIHSYSIWGRTQETFEDLCFSEQKLKPDYSSLKKNPSAPVTPCDARCLGTQNNPRAKTTVAKGIGA